MRRIPVFVVLAVKLFTAPVAAQQLVAWPMGTTHPFLQSLLPGEHTIRTIRRPGPEHFPQPTPMPTLPPDVEPVTLSGYHIEGIVIDQAAELNYRITFHNPTDRRLEGVLMVPIPADTVLSGFSMTVGGKTTKGELLESSQAATIYEGIVRQARDPGLLELVGERMLRARVFPIEARGDIVAELKLTQALPQSGGLVSLRLPMRSARFASVEAGHSSARIELRTTRSLRTLFAPNAGVHIERHGEREAIVRYEEGVEGPQDLALMFSMQADPLSAGVLAYRESGEDGSFMLTLSPKVQPVSQSLPKDIVFVVDRSGSMGDDGKMDQAKKALQYCVGRLGVNDRFGLVDFATESNSLESSLLPATPENKSRAQRYIGSLEAAGGTNIEAALLEGLRLLEHSDGRMPMMFFLTDGLPTIGQTDVNALIAEVSKANTKAKVRLFNFGVGSDVNTLLLDKLADGGRGARDYVAPGEDIETKVSSLYQKVARPALTDVKVEWRGVETNQVYPRPVPDLFHGSELTLYGRYKAAGRGALIVTAKAGEHDVRFEYPVELPGEQTQNSFLPRLWASQKVAHELDALRLSNRPADPEAVASIVKLAKKYGIVTPYTSFLVTEEGADNHVSMRRASRGFSDMTRGAFTSGFGGSGAGSLRAQSDSTMLQSMMNSPASAGAAALSGSALKARAELKATGVATVDTRTIGDKTFYLRAKTWTDADAELDEALNRTPVAITARSAEYFALLAKHPTLWRWLALGENVTVMWRGIIYKISAP